MNKRFPSEHYFGLIGLVLLGIGSYVGLVVAPPDQYMGEVGRILYCHVPTAWNALLMLTIACVVGVGYLINRKTSWDDVLVGAIEVGVVYTIMLLIQGSIWGRPTWGTYWDWDPRLTSSAVMLIAFAAILGLRTFVDDANRRAVWTAVATIVAFVDVPIVYFSIKWWRTLHQEFSSPQTVAASMKLPLRMNAFALLFIAIWLIARRARIEKAKRLKEGGEVAEPTTSTLIAGQE
ncbi:MAG: cytochrome c biogenesis protein CcsA [Deltaproteobacteria bacterium]|nr:cytochrome c biogenesis protein CcsA [Deltaproteobacteria bacterium]